MAESQSQDENAREAIKSTDGIEKGREGILFILDATPDMHETRPNNEPSYFSQCLGVRNINDHMNTVTIFHFFNLIDLILDHCRPIRQFSVRSCHGTDVTGWVLYCSELTNGIRIQKENIF